MRVESSGFRRETEKDGSLDTDTILLSGARFEMPDVLPGVLVGSLASVVEYISGLTEGSLLIPFCS